MHVRLGVPVSPASSGYPRKGNARIESNLAGESSIGVIITDELKLVR